MYVHKILNGHHIYNFLFVDLSVHLLKNYFCHNTLNTKLRRPTKPQIVHHFFLASIVNQTLKNVKMEDFLQNNIIQLITIKFNTGEPDFLSNQAIDETSPMICIAVTCWVGFDYFKEIEG